MLTREQYFPGQAPQEQVALFIRRHIVSFLPWIVATFFLSFGLIFLTFYFWITIPNLVSTSIGSAEGRVYLLVVSSALTLILLFHFLRSWMSYYLDVTIVTERRLVDIRQKGIFSRSIAEQSLFRVQDVSAKQRGFLQHFFNYGTIFVETAGEQPNFELLNIPHPNEFAKTIIDLHDRLIDATGHDIDISVDEGRSLQQTSALVSTNGNGQKRNKPLERSAKQRHHPLEALQPYFPEPGHEHDADEVTKTSNQPRTPAPSPSEGELAEGETIHLNQGPKGD